MKRVLALDLSTKTGWAELSSAQPNSVSVEGYGRIVVPSFSTKGDYPWNYADGAGVVAEKIKDLIVTIGPEDLDIAIEETNLGRSRYAQKALEFIHKETLRAIEELVPRDRVKYISSSEWRSTLGLKLTPEDRAANKKLKEAVAVAAATGSKVDKKALGVSGKVSAKHLSVRWVNETFGLDLKMKDNDAAEAICLGTALILGAKTCNGR